MNEKRYVMKKMQPKDNKFCVDLLEGLGDRGATRADIFETCKIILVIIGRAWWLNEEEWDSHMKDMKDFCYLEREKDFEEWLTDLMGSYVGGGCSVMLGDIMYEEDELR